MTKEVRKMREILAIMQAYQVLSVNKADVRIGMTNRDGKISSVDVYITPLDETGNIRSRDLPEGGFTYGSENFTFYSFWDSKENGEMMKKVRKFLKSLHIL